MEGIDLPDGIGFGLFSAKHFAAVALCAVGVVLLLRAFLRRTPDRQLHWLRVTAAALLVGNLARDFFLLCRGRMTLAYLPFHLCSFAIFVYLLHAFLPEAYVGDKLCYTGDANIPDASDCADSTDAAAAYETIFVQPHFREALGEIGCVLLLPGTVAALILPDWSAYPLLNFMCIHSFLWHAVLAAYPLMLLLSHRVHLTIRHIWYTIVYLAILVPPTLWFDRRFDVNFLFINWPLPDTPLMMIYDLLGKYWLVGYALFVLVVLLAEYILIEFIRRIEKKQRRYQKKYQKC